MTSPRTLQRRQERARYARTNQPIGNFLINDPDGFPSGQEPVSAFWWWGSDQMRPTPNAIGLSAVQRATSLIVGTLSSLPIRILTGGASRALSRIETPTPRWLVDPMLARPDDRFTGSPSPSALVLTGSAFWSEFLRSAVWHGNAYFIFEEDALGGPIAGTCRILNPDLVTPQYDSDTGVTFRRIGDEIGGSYVDTDETGRVLLGGRVYRLVQLRNPHSPVDGMGMAMGVLEMCRGELALATQAVSYGSSMYRAGVPAGYLKTTLPSFTKPQSDLLKSQWMAAHGGDRRSIAVLNATTEFHPIQMSPVDMALIEMRRMNLTDVSNAFGVPAYFLGGGDGGSNVYSNAESRNSDLRQSLMPWGTAFEELLTSLFPAQSWVEIDWRGILKPDVVARYGAYSQALKDGWLTVDEVRAIESLPPLPGGATINEEVPDGAAG